MLTKEQKTLQINDLTDKLQKSKAVVLATYRGLKLDELTELRRTLKKEGISIQVVKNTLLKRVFEADGKDISEETLEKPLAVVFSASDEITPAKLVAAFSKEHEKLEIVGGVYEDKVVASDVILQLALLPSRDELLARVVGSLSAPVSRFVGALRWNGYALASVLRQRLEQVQN